MHRQFMRFFIAASLLIFISACTAPRIRTRVYVDEKQRVDQEMNGNAGFLVGKPAVRVESPAKKTRKIYVLEFTKSLQPPPRDEELYGKDLSKEAISSSYEIPSRRKIEPITTHPEISIPPITADDLSSDAEEPMAGGENYVKYTVLEKDTLQKISKKFYGSYSQWHKIYEANKEKIKNPDAIKPGTMIKIPLEK